MHLAVVPGSQLQAQTDCGEGSSAARCKAQKQGKGGPVQELLLRAAWSFGQPSGLLRQESHTGDSSAAAWGCPQPGTEAVMFQSGFTCSGTQQGKELSWPAAV